MGSGLTVLAIKRNNPGGSSVRVGFAFTDPPKRRLLFAIHADKKTFPARVRQFLLSTEKNALGGPGTADSLICCQMFAFSRWSQRNGEAKCPGFLLAETASDRLRRRLHKTEQRSAAAFLVLTGPLQNGEDRACTVRIRSVPPASGLM